MSVKCKNYDQFSQACMACSGAFKGMDCFEKPTEAPKNQTPFGLLERLVINTMQFIYAWWLVDYVGDTKHKQTIVRVKGWRTFLVDGVSGRKTVTPIFKIWKWYL